MKSALIGGYRVSRPGRCLTPEPRTLYPLARVGCRVSRVGCRVLFSLATLNCAFYFAFFILHSSFCIASDWPQLQCDAQRTGRIQDQLEPPFHVAWGFDTSENDLGLVEEVVQPIVYRGKLYFGTLFGHLACVDAATGRFLWSHKIEHPINHTAAAVDGMIVFACLSGNVYAIDSETGETKWRFEPPGGERRAGFSTAPCVADGGVFIGNRMGHFFRISADDGKMSWRVKVDAPIQNSAAYNNGRVFFGDERLVVHCLDAKTGETVWASPRLYGQSFKDLHPVIVNGRVLINSMGIGHSGHWAATYLESGYKDNLIDKSDRGGGGSGLEVEFVARKDFHPARDAAYRHSVEYMKEHPYLQTSFVLDEQTGQIALVPEQFRTASMNSPVPMPAITKDGLASVPILYRRLSPDWHTSAFGLMDPATGEISMAFVPTTKGLNADETSAFSIGGDVLIVVHGHEYGHMLECGYSAAFDLRVPAVFPMPSWQESGMDPRKAVEQCKYGHAVVSDCWESGNHAPSISDHRVYAFWSRAHMTCWADSTVPKSK